MAVQDASPECFDEDDWLFSSTMRYDSLHMFELSHPVKAIDWVNSKYVGIGTAETFGYNEILMLSVPERLLTEGDEEEGLAEERDFHVCAGAVHEEPLVGAQFVSDSRLLFTSEQKSSIVTSWQLPEGQEHNVDIIKKEKTFSGLCPSIQASQFCIDSHKSLILGTELGRVTLQHLEAHCPEPLLIAEHSEGFGTELLACILNVDHDTVALCSRQAARVVLVDTRSRTVVHHVTNVRASTQQAMWTSCVKGVHCLSTSSKGQLVAFDIRKGGAQPLASCDTGHIWRGSLRENRDLCIRMSPCDDDTFSVSGLDSVVRIYSQKAMLTCNTLSLKPLFEHDGHKINGLPAPTVFNHLWHPEIANMIISSDSDGGLQCWKYKT